MSAARQWGTIDLRDRYQGLIGAILVFATALCAAAHALAAESTRTISLYNIHNQETLVSTYKKDGKYVPAEMQKINWILRDWRKNEATTMDPELIDLLWEVHNELGSKEPIHIISGYRSRGTNELLQKDRRRTGEREPPHSRQGCRRAFPGRAREGAALLGADPREGRRRLLSNLRHPVRAHGHRSRARLAAAAARRACAAVPQGQLAARSKRRGPDHPR